MDLYFFVAEMHHRVSIKYKQLLKDTYPAPRGPLPFRALAANRTNDDINSDLQLMLVFFQV